MERDGERVRERQAKTDRHTEIETDKYTETEKDRETERKRDRGRDRQTDRELEIKRERESACKTTSQNDKEKKYCIVGFSSTLTNPEIRQLVLFQANPKSNSSQRYSKASAGFYD